MTSLLYTDAAIEVKNRHETALGPEGFRDLIQREKVGEGSLNKALGRVEEALLKYSNSVRLSDDLTLLAARSAP